MNSQIAYLPLIRTILQNLAKCWGPLTRTSIFFRLVVFSLLTPIVGLLFCFFLQTTGKNVLADADIAIFLLHPMGLLALAIVGGALVCESALEQAALLTISLGAESKCKFRPVRVLRFVIRQAPQILRLAIHFVVRCAMICLPFLAISGCIYWLLLTDHDVNFYLRVRPMKFWFAMSFIATVLAGMFGLLVRALCGWIYALPLLLFERSSPLAAFSDSAFRAHGHRRLIGGMFTFWFALNIGLNMALTILMIAIGRMLLPFAAVSIASLSAAVGGLLVTTFICQLLSSIVASTSAASTLGMLYLRHAEGNNLVLPVMTDGHEFLFQLRFTRGRVAAGAIIAALVAALLGAVTILNTHLEDRVQVTAHRGGAGVAPENTIAAIRKAIAAKADWVEIDVQESKDGVVVVTHDSDLKKLANNPIKIWEATADELSAIDIGSSFSSEFRDERIPTLDEVLQVCKDKVGVNIELKYYGHDQNLEQRVIDLVEKHNMATQIVVMSLKSKGVAKVKALRPEWQCGLLTAVALGRLDSVNADFLAVKSTLATREFIVRAHREKKKVYAWTLNDEYAMSTLISRGVDNIVTDFPEMARSVLALRNEMSPPERLLIELAMKLGISPAQKGKTAFRALNSDRIRLPDAPFGRR